MAKYIQYWEDKRLNKGLSFKQISKLLNMTDAGVRNYFTGRTSPTPDKMKILCDALDADYDEGRNAFLQAYYQYRVDHRQKLYTPQLIVPDKYKTRPKPPPNITPRAYKDTFWNRLRIARNLRIVDIQRQMYPKQGNTGRIKLYNWLNGRNVPPEARAREICDFFGVDYAKGMEEFKIAHSEWLSARNHRIFQYSTTENIKQKTWILDTEESILHNIYSKISYEEYKIFESNLKQRLYKEAFQTLYGKLNFDDYYQIQASVDTLSKA